MLVSWSQLEMNVWLSINIFSYELNLFFIQKGRKKILKKGHVFVTNLLSVKELYQVLWDRGSIKNSSMLKLLDFAHNFV